MKVLVGEKRWAGGRAEGVPGDALPPPVKVTFRDVVTARKNGAYNHALQLLNALENTSGLPAHSDLTKAQLFRSVQCLTDARDLLSAQIRTQPDNLKARLLLLEVARSLNDAGLAAKVAGKLTGRDSAIAGLKLSIATGDTPQAWLQSQQAILLWPDDPVIVSMHCDVLTQRLELRAAADLLDTELGKTPEDHVLFMKRAQVALAVNDTQTAARMLKKTLPTPQVFQVHQRLDEVFGKTRAHSDKQINARLAQLLALEAEGKVTCAVHMEMGDLLFVKGDWRGALRQFQLAEADSGQNRARTMKVARCLYRLLDFKSCRHALQRVLDKAPHRTDALVLRANTDLIEGRSADSIETLKQVFDIPDARQISHGVRLFRALMRIEDVQGAADVKERLISMSDQRFEPELIDCLAQFGSADAAFDLCVPWAKAAVSNGVHTDLLRAVEQASKRSFGLDWPQPSGFAEPATGFKTGQKLAEQGGRKPGKVTDLAVPLSLKTAWHVSDHQKIGFDAWQAVARLATQNIRRQSNQAPRREDIAEVTEMPDRSVLGKYANTDQPLILLSSHAGPAVASALNDTLLAGRAIAYLRRQPVDDRQEDGLISVGNDLQAAAKELVKAVSCGKTVGLAVDSPVLWQSGGRTAKGAHGTLFGVPVTISATPLKLAQAFDRPMFWLQPLWRDGRIVFEIEEMAVPDKSMRFQEAADIWAADYLARVEKVMRSGPENQDLSAPMWQHLVYNGPEIRSAHA